MKRYRVLVMPADPAFALSERAERLLCGAAAGRRLVVIGGTGLQPVPKGCATSPPVGSTEEAIAKLEPLGARPPARPPPPGRSARN